LLALFFLLPFFGFIGSNEGLGRLDNVVTRIFILAKPPAVPWHGANCVLLFYIFKRHRNGQILI
jgi:hypothetical protein